MDLTPERRHEELHADLQDYLDETPFGTSLRHPLVYQVPLFHNGLANDSYAAKQKYTAQALAEQDWFGYVHWFERPYRLTAFLEIQEHLSDQEYWSLAADVWTDSENIHQMLDEWAEVFGSKRKGKRAGLMETREYNRWRGLPETVTIYRGCQRELNEDGWSWTLDRAKAEWFAHRFKGDGALVIEATVRRQDILALFLGRGESEIIAYPNCVDIVKYLEV